MRTFKHDNEDGAKTTKNKQTNKTKQNKKLFYRLSQHKFYIQGDFLVSLVFFYQDHVSQLFLAQIYWFWQNFFENKSENFENFFLKKIIKFFKIFVVFYCNFGFQKKEIGKGKKILTDRPYLTGLSAHKTGLFVFLTPNVHVTGVEAPSWMGGGKILLVFIPHPGMI